MLTLNQSQTRPEQLADAYVALAVANHYMLEVTHMVTQDEYDAAEQILIRRDNDANNADANLNVALDLLEADKKQRFGL
jgi:hypothetical protein